MRTLRGPWRIVAVLCVALATGLGTLPATAGTGTEGSLMVSKGHLEEVLGLLAILVFMAALVERAQEVFISTWRDAQAGTLLEAVELEKMRLVALDASVDSATLHEAQESYHQSRLQVIRYRGQTRRIAFIGGSVVGIVLAAVAVPVLRDPAVTNFIEVRQSLESLQIWSFMLADIVLTGALLGGGAEGVHRVVNVVTSFLDGRGGGWGRSATRV